MGRIGSEEKRFFVAGHVGGLDHEYSHVDLVLGRFAPDEIYPRVADWLDAHKPAVRAAPRRGRAPVRRGRSSTRP